MNPIEQVALGFQACVYTVREAGNRALWAPFVLWFAAGLLVLPPLLLWAHPALSWALAPWVARVAGASALHYPDYFRHLPGLAAHARAGIDLVVGAVLAGVATDQFGRRWHGGAHGFGEAWRRVRGRWPALVLVALPPLLLLAGADLAAQHVVAPRLSSLARGALPLALTAGGLVVRAAWGYAVALVVLDDRGPVEAWRELPHTWMHGLLPALVVLALAALVQLPASWLVARSTAVVDRGVPDLVAGIVAVRGAFAVFAAFLSTGALTLVWTSVFEHRGDGG